MRSPFVALGLFALGAVSGCEGGQTAGPAPAPPEDVQNMGASPEMSKKSPAAAAAPPSSFTRRGRHLVPETIEKVERSEAEWRRLLDSAAYHVVRQKGTERAFTGAYWDHHADGTYLCAACELPLYGSETKFDSGTGWPSYWAPLDPRVLRTESDRSFFMVRNELLCARCGGHLGHVFDDGPEPTGTRHCINSASLKFLPASEQ
jgi:peptide-methionine (R)-S-oxide reductase